MIATWKQYEGQAVDGIPLLRLLGGSEASAVFLGELAGVQCAIKLVPAEDSVAQVPLARWQQASKLSQPNLVKIHQWGRAHLNGKSFVYLAMEYGEEELSSVDRPLTPKEARELLTPAVSALEFLHAQKFAHGRIRPSNILSVNEVLKISGDAPLRFGDKPSGGPASPYDAPELPNSGVTAACDVWSLGVTLVQGVTKELPEVEADPPRLPESLKPDSFRAVAAGCLQRDPAKRWTMADLAQWLERGTLPAPKKAPRRFLVPAVAAAALVVVGLIVWPHLAGHAASTAPAAINPASGPAPTSTISSAAAAPPDAAATQEAQAPPAPAPVVQPAPVSEPAPESRKPGRKGKATSEANATVDAKTTPDAAKPGKSKAAQPVAEASPAAASQPAPQEDTQAADKQPSPADVIPDGVTQPVKPEVPSKARATIHGKVPIFIRVETDPSGSVTAATVESGKSSQYFANLSLKAAKEWKFAPSEGAGAWLLKFEFTHNADHPVSMQASRMK